MPKLTGYSRSDGRHVGEHVLKSLVADILLKKLLLETSIDHKQHFELDADIGDVAQEGDVIRRVAESNTASGCVLLMLLTMTV